LAARPRTNLIAEKRLCNRRSARLTSPRRSKPPRKARRRLRMWWLRRSLATPDTASELGSAHSSHARIS